MSVTKAVSQAIQGTAAKVSQMKFTPESKTVALNMAKWGGTPAAAGAGIYALSAGVGGAVDNVSNALDPTKSGSGSYVAWIVILALVGVALYLGIPKLKKVIG